MKPILNSTLLNQIVTVIIILGVFFFFRWYRLEETLLFYNDMGRDYITMLNWYETGKPPLLGPQTSVVSYNQSAWYFYFLYPLFLLTGHWPLSSTLTLTLVGAGVYLAVAWITKHDKHYFWLVSFVFLLLAVQPQVVLQNRFIWNPSFIPYFLFIHLIALLHIKTEFSNRWAVAFWLSAAFAVGFSYSAVPLVITSVGYLLIFKREYLLRHTIIASVSAFIVLLPLLAFEARHSFALTKLFLEGQTTPQTAADSLTKSGQLVRLLFPAQSVLVSISALIASALVLAAGYAYALKKRLDELNNIRLFLTLLAINTALFLVLPVNLEKHYIFPVLLLVLFSIATLPIKYALTGVICLTLVWSQPYFISWHTQLPARTIADMQQCYQHFCTNFKQPTYVSMESGILTGYHNALEHQFFLREAGCTVYDIIEHQDQATTMLVIGDAADYTHGQSAYYELSLFGPATLSGEFTCTDKLKIYQIDKR